MHQRDIAKIPKKISRERFVSIIFDLGRDHQHGLDTIVSAVQLGDYFVSYNGYRPIYKLSSTDEQTSQEYSVELAYAVTVITAKYNEDSGYNLTNQAIIDTNNIYVVKIEWEICMICEFHINMKNFATLLGDIAEPLLERGQRFHSVFWDLSKHICMNMYILSKNPSIIVLSLVILHKIGKLSATKINRERRFIELMLHISYSYNIDINMLINTMLK